MMNRHEHEAELVSHLEGAGMEYWAAMGRDIRAEYVDRLIGDDAEDPRDLAAGIMAEALEEEGRMEEFRMEEFLRNIIIEMMNLQTNIHDGEYEICGVLESLYDWEKRIRASLARLEG